MRNPHASGQRGPDSVAAGSRSVRLGPRFTGLISAQAGCALRALPHQCGFEPHFAELAGSATR